MSWENEPEPESAPIAALILFFVLLFVAIGALILAVGNS